MELKANKDMQTKGEQTPLAAGLKTVPSWAWLLAAAGFFCAQYYFNFVLSGQSAAPAAWARAAMGVMAGTVLACYLLFIGYVNRDAPRRKMSSALWTFVAVLIPNGLGILLYFILRQPLPSAFSGAANPLGTGHSACPRCGYQLSASCPQCQCVVGGDDSYCRSCGTSLHSQSAAVL